MHSNFIVTSIYGFARSLEPLTGLAVWSSEPQIIELIKGERGLGFSILDYQVIILTIFEALETKRNYF